MVLTLFSLFQEEAFLIFLREIENLKTYWKGQEL